MNSFAALVLVAFALGTTVAPWRQPDWKRPATALGLELAALLVALGLWHLFTDHISLPSLRPIWGQVAVIAAAYWYACVGGMAIVRLVLGLVPVGERPGAGGITVSATELGRGQLIGVLERALALTLILGGQFGALGLILAAKALTRFRALDDRDFAEYVLIGTLASLLLALLVGVGVTIVI
ncbi:MAG: hypothetical protein ACREN5_14565 [Gemmatimonadales bacterium]